MKIAKRMAQLQPSVTLATSAKAAALKATGADVLSLTLGEPDFITPESVREAAIASIETGKASFYTPTAGIPALREAIIKRTQLDYGLTYQLDEVAVTTGAKFALYALFQVLLDEADEVLIPVPYWVSYAEEVKLAQGVPVFVQGQKENQFKLTIEQLEEKRTAKTKVLLLNSPNNPTGSVYTAEELMAIGNWAVEHDLYIIADDIYGKLVYNGATFTSIAQLSDEIRARTVIVNGVSKSYAMTGWRIGYCLGASEVIQGVVAIASQATSNCSTVSQYAALEALSGPQDFVEDMRVAFEARLNAAYPLVKNLPGVQLAKPQGAFYLFPNIEETLTLCGYTDVTTWVNDLLTEAHVAVVTGEGFGAPGYIRLSYATSSELFAQAIERIERFIAQKIAANKCN